VRLAQNGQGIVVHHHRAGVDAVALADANDLAVEGHLIVGLGMWFSLCLPMWQAQARRPCCGLESVLARNCCGRDGIDKKERPPALPQAAQV
jgi:hypothetical protein